MVAKMLLDTLRIFKEFVGDNDIQVQTIQVFLKIGSSSVSPSMEELVKATGIGMSAVSRNIKKLALGLQAQPGYGLINVELDPWDNRRRILSLNIRGKELMKKIENSVQSHIQHVRQGPNNHT